MRKNIFIQIIFIFVMSERLGVNSQQDQLTPQPGQLASASPQKGIKYNHEDWGKPINYYINLKNNNVAPQEKLVDPPQDPAKVPNASTKSRSTMHRTQDS